MTNAATAKSSIVIPSVSPHGQDARATSRDSLGCELAAEVLRSTGRLRLRAVGGSMMPAIWPGDILSVCSHDAAEGHPGDIVVFRRAGRLVTHRLVERTVCRDRIQWATRRDRVHRNDAPVSNHELLGRVTAIARGGRRVNPRLTLPKRVAAWILRRSDLYTRALLHLRNRFKIQDSRSQDIGD
jgi:signal peptidase I